MATKLDGHEVKVGDLVIDLILGGGTVEELTSNNSMRVAFEGGRVFSFDDGVRTNSGQRRTLFWHDPVIVQPPKDAAVWGAVRSAIQTMDAQFKQVVEGR